MFCGFRKSIQTLFSATAAFVFFSGTAWAGLCGAEFSTNWTANPLEQQTVFPGLTSSGFNGCVTESAFTGTTETPLSNGETDEDGFAFSVSATDDNTLLLTGFINNLDGNDFFVYPGATLSLTDIAFLDGQGGIVDVVPSSTGFLVDLVDFTANSITFNFTGNSVGIIFDEISESLFLTDEFTVVFAQVPEPGSMAMLGLGLAAFGLLGRRNSKPAKARFAQWPRAKTGLAS